MSQTQLVTRNRLGILALLLLAAVLWLPLGQQDFLVMQWMKVGTIMAPFILLAGLSGDESRRHLLDDPRTASVIMTFAYLVHQFEEHWVDLFGQIYAFHASTNALLHHVLGQTGSQPDILTPEAIFVANTSLVWMVGAIAIWRSPKALFPSLALAAITLINAIIHIASGLVQWTYNPGLLTAACIFIPLSLAYYRRTVRHHPDCKRMIAGSLIWAIAAHVLLVIGAITSTYLTIVPVTAYYVALIAWAIMPAFLHRAHGSALR